MTRCFDWPPTGIVTFEFPVTVSQSHVPCVLFSLVPDQDLSPSDIPASPCPPFGDTLCLCLILIIYFFVLTLPYLFATNNIHL